MNQDKQPFLVAEIGVNHDGHLERAAEMVRGAAEAGFDAVKFQYWIEDELLAADAPNAPYQGAGDQRELLRSLLLDIDELSELRKLAGDEGIEFGITADGTRALNGARALAPDFLKVGSGDADNPWLLDAVAKSKLPVVLSVGMSSDDDVLWMLETLRGATDVTVLHCVSAYPTPLEELNLCRMSRLSQMTDHPVGLSDHTIGVAAASAAVALDASMIEKHVTWSTTASGPDHAASLSLDTADRWVRDVRGVYEAVHLSKHSGAEEDNRRVVRKGLYSLHDLDQGAEIKLEDLVPLRPLLDGIPARERDNVIGRVLATSVEAGRASHGRTLSESISVELVRVGDPRFDLLLADDRPEPFCQPGYLRALWTGMGIEPVVVTTTGDEWRGSLVLLLRSVGSDGWIARTPDFGGPECEGGGNEARLMRSAVDGLLRSEGIISEVTLFSPWRTGAKDLLVAWQARPEKVVQLLWITDLPAVRAAMSSGRRYDLRRAERNLKCETRDFTPVAGRQFADHYADLMDRHNAEERFLLGPQYFDALAIQAGSSLVLTEATDGDSGASVLYLYDRSRAAYLHSVRWGSSTGATTLCNWRAFERLAELGVEEVNLGGGLTAKSDDPLLAFKQGFGGSPAELYLAARVYDPEAHERAVSSGSARPLPTCAVHSVSCWDKVFSSQDWGRWPDIDAVRAISTAAKARNCSLNVLEIGCGPGAELRYLGHEGHRAIGLDLSSIALGQARMRLDEEHTSASLVRGDAVVLPFSNERFDVVLDVEAFAHCPAGNFEMMWIEVARVLSHGGIFVSIGFSKDSSVHTGLVRKPSEDPQQASQHPLAGKGQVVFLDEERVRELARSAGFEQITVDHRAKTFNDGASTIEEFVSVARRT